MARKNVPIRYAARDFASIRDALIDHAQRYYPDTFKDFNEAGFGSLMIDLISYIGDIESFNLDYGVNESFLETAAEYASILRHGRARGYKFTGAPTSFGVATFYVVVPAASNGNSPNSAYLPVLQRGTQVSSLGGASFTLNADVDFSNANNETVVSRVDATTGVPTHYAIKAVGEVISGELKSETVLIGDYQKFLRVALDTNDIAEVISIIDAEGHEYYEVDSLSENTIYKSLLNNDTATREFAPNLLVPVVVPRRFVSDRENRKTFLQFGHGSTAFEKDSEYTIDPANTMMNVYGKDYISDVSFDPTRLIQTDKFGVAPANTTLLISLRVNSSNAVNVGAKTLTALSNVRFSFDNVSTLDSGLVGEVISSLEVTNEEPISGATSIQEPDELKQRISGHFATQKRAVTAEDYIMMAYAMPKKFGSIKRATVMKDEKAFRRNLDMYVVTENADVQLAAANTVVKENLKRWLSRYKMINDTIDIRDARIINLGIEFTAVSDLSKNKFEVLTDSLEAVQNKFASPGNIGGPFFVTDVYEALRNVEGVLDVSQVKVRHLRGGNYSDGQFIIEDALSPDGRYLTAPKDTVFEVKFLDVDIKGSIS